MLFFLFFTFKGFSQIQGKVTDKNNNPLPFITVVLKKAVDSTFVSYSRTNTQGFYTLDTKEKGSFLLGFSSLGYAKQEQTITLLESTTPYIANAVLYEKVETLDEVVVQTTLDINQKKDTIVINAKAFAQGNEEVVEDLLKKIPGLHIEADGTIKIGGQEIEKVMVEGDDFFERGYKILTKNMPAQPIEKIELLQNYTNNRLLKGIEETDKVALNLKLDKDAKRIWFGNISIAYDAFANENRYFAKGNLMNFGKKNKYYFLTNLNNTGYNATGDINHLIRPFRFNEPASIGDNQSISSLLNLTANPPNFKRSRTTFNNAEMASLNAIFNPTKKLKIKTLAFFNSDELLFFRNRKDNVQLNNSNFTNVENYELQNRNRIGFGKLDFIYSISNTQELETVTKYENAHFTSTSNLVFNAKATTENLKNPVTLLDQKISYTHKLTNRKVFLLTGRFINENSPQNYKVNKFLFKNLFPNTDANSIEQQLTQKMTFVGIEAHLLDKKEHNNLLEIKIGNSFRKDILNSTFSLLENNNFLVNPSEYQNQLAYTVNNLYTKIRYKYQLKKIKFVGNLELHQLFNKLSNQNNITENQQPFYINPSIGLDWKINTKNRIRTSYSQNTTNAEIINTYSNFLLTSFRDFNKGTGSFNQLNASTLLLNYKLGNWSDRFFANVTFGYTKNHDFFSTNTQIKQNFTQAESIIIKDRESLNANTSLDYFLKKLSGNLKINFGFTQSDYKNVVNNSELRKIISENYQYGAEFKSAFNSFFDLNIGTKWLTNKIKTTMNNKFTDTMSFLDLTFVFNKKFNFDLQSERYFFGNLKTNSTYYFLDFNARYTVKENKLTFMISGRNLFNTNTFTNFSISDIGNSTTEYRLLPRFILLKMEYRF